MKFRSNHRARFSRVSPVPSVLSLVALSATLGCSFEDGDASSNAGVGGTRTSDGTTDGTGGAGLASGETSGGSTGASGGASAGDGGTACAYQCVPQCSQLGGNERAGVCESGGVCCEGAVEGAENPLAHMQASAEEIGTLLANRFERTNLPYSSVANLPGDGYKHACEWYGALGVANLTDNRSLLDDLVSKFDPFKTNFVEDMKNGSAHVDRYVYGMVPLEIYLQTDDASYLSLGTETADHQQVTDQTRGAVDDMFMMTGLQVQAYRATGDTKYLDFMSDTMVDYLEDQQENGLFYHHVTEAPFHWGRGNGWFAAGMAEMMRDLPTEHENYPAIEAGYLAMMKGLLEYQSDTGLWYQVLDMPDDPDNWEETSGTAMFTYAMVAGVRRGVLDADTFVPVIEKAWAGLQSMLSEDGALSNICTGTWYQSSADGYFDRARVTGDGHGQAPMLWVAAELLR